MSKTVERIVKMIKESPESWHQIDCETISNGGIKIKGLGNGAWWFGLWFTSVVEVEINGLKFPYMSWQDKYNLEETFGWWVNNIELSHLQKNRGA